MALVDEVELFAAAATTGGWVLEVNGSWEVWVVVVEGALVVVVACGALVVVVVCGGLVVVVVCGGLVVVVGGGLVVVVVLESHLLDVSIAFLWPNSNSQGVGPTRASAWITPQKCLGYFTVRMPDVPIAVPTRV